MRIQRSVLLCRDVHSGRYRCSDDYHEYSSEGSRAVPRPCKEILVSFLKASSRSCSAATVGDPCRHIGFSE